MLVTFRSTSYANITMFGDIAEKLLKMMQQSGEVPGAILTDALPAALESLTSQIEKIEPAVANDLDDEAPISLATRARPLVQMLEASIASGADVIWEY